MNGFIIATLIAILLFGLPVGFLFAFGAVYWENDKWYKKTIIAIVIALIAGITITGMCYSEIIMDNNTWNDGTCSLCDGEWDLVSVSKSRMSGDFYYYECVDCGHTIRTYNSMR